MKLLIVGSDQVWSIEKIYLNHFKELGVDIKLFPAQNLFYTYYQHSLLHKLIFRLGMSDILKKVNFQLRKGIEEFSPEVVWVFKGMEVFPDTLRWMKKKNIMLVNYNPDNPFLFSGSGSGNKNLKDSILLYDLHFTYHDAIANKLIDMGCSVNILPFGFELSESIYFKCLSEEEKVKTCFLGNPDKFRADFIKKLADKGVELEVYGHGWSSFLNHPRVTIHGAVYGDEFWKTLRRYRIQLNLMRPHNESGHNMRSFEIPAVGGIQLAPDTPEHRKYFNQGSEIFLFSSIENCLDHIKYLSGLSLEHISIIRNLARQKSISAGYDYKNRASAVFQVIRKRLLVSKSL